MDEIMRIIKLDDEEIQLYVIKHIDGNRFRIPIQVDENDELRKNQIPDGVIMVKSYGEENKHYKGLWNKEYEYDKAPYVETAKSLDELLSKLEKYNCYVFNWEVGERLL